MAKQDRTPTRHDLEAKIVKHCWEDEAFREEFIADPAGTFVKHLKVPGASLPKIFVHQEQPGSWHIVLPAKPANTSELSEGELEKVAGGVTDPVLMTLLSAGQVGISTGSVQPPTVEVPLGVETPPIWNPTQQGW